jgi:uroporphyrinogen-III synthase
MADLLGQRVVVTRASVDFEALAQLLRRRGARPIAFPTITIHAVTPTPDLNHYIDRLDQIDWLVLTSANGVQALARLLGERRLPDDLRIAAVGPKTAAAIRAQGWAVAYVPQRYRAAAILPGLGDMGGKRILLARGQLAADGLPRAIRAGGGEVIDLVVYHTRPHAPGAAALAALQRGVDVVTFTSASTVDHFVASLRSASLDPANLAGNPRFAYIGPVTAAAGAAHGLGQHIIAGTHTLEGLVKALEAHFALEGARLPHE